MTRIDVSQRRQPTGAVRAGLRRPRFVAQKREATTAAPESEGVVAATKTSTVMAMTNVRPSQTDSSTPGTAPSVSVSTSPQPTFSSFHSDTRVHGGRAPAEESQHGIPTNASVISDDDDEDDKPKHRSRNASGADTDTDGALRDVNPSRSNQPSENSIDRVRPGCSLNKKRVLPSAPRSENSVLPLQQLATAELEDFRTEQLQLQAKSTSTSQNNASKCLPSRSFPAACHRLVSKLPGNSNCMDCGKLNPQWATVSFGALVCLDCAGHHRSLGVSISTVRSLTMDHWKLHEILQMLEGGNAQLSTFFRRHGLHSGATNFHSASSALTATNVVQVRYKTKAAQFYSRQLFQHVLAVPFPYAGRRQQQQQQNARTKTADLSKSNPAVPRPVTRSLSPTPMSRLPANPTNRPPPAVVKPRRLMGQTSNMDF